MTLGPKEEVGLSMAVPSRGVIRSTGRALERGSFIRAARVWSGLGSEVWDAGAMGAWAERPEGTGRRAKGTFKIA